mmetsp:Transcript_8447/g.37712  ORF Transcript_8447/g.37712 Transcript_8447/m.37712 type:complete len:91 (+) Transcript_8447:1125-1397(+)
MRQPQTLGHSVLEETSAEAGCARRHGILFEPEGSDELALLSRPNGSLTRPISPAVRNSRPRANRGLSDGWDGALRKQPLRLYAMLRAEDS